MMWCTDLFGSKKKKNASINGVLKGRVLAKGD